MKSGKDFNNVLITGILQAAPTGTGGDIEEDAAGLACICESIKSALTYRIEANDLEILKFSLHQLLYSIDILYRTELPGLSTSFEPSAGILNKLTHYHHLWRQLLEIKSVLERLEPLCQLLNRTTTHMLEALDRAQGEEVSQEEKEMSDIERALRSGEHPWLQIIAQEQLGKAFIRLTKRQESWRQSNRERLSFATQFHHLRASIAAIEQIDRAFDLLLDSVCSIFSNILPDLQMSSREDDKTTITLLLDLVQKTDQQQQQIDQLQEALRLLIRQYTRAAEIDRS